MTGTMRVPRTRGVLSGTLLVLLGLWGGLIPFIGPYLDFGFAPDDPWVYDTDRLQLSVAPGAAAALGGLIVLFSANRAFAVFGAWIAALGGAWFVVGGPVATLWDVPGIGAPLGTEEGRRLGEQLAAFDALGVIIVFLAALALGRFAVVGVKEARQAEEEEIGYGDHPGPAGGSGRGGESGTTQPIAPVFGRYGRESRTDPKQGAPGFQGPDDPGDQRVAGDPGERSR